MADPKPSPFNDVEGKAPSKTWPGPLKLAWLYYAGSEKEINGLLDQTRDSWQDYLAKHTASRHHQR